MAKIIVLKSHSHNPWHNLAIEDYLLNHPYDPDQALLYLWQNQNTVVIGRNQNAWAECNTALLEAENGKLARRTTGGGAVFHDLGNLNFSLIFSQDLYKQDYSFEIILSAVRAAGIDAERSGRNDILVQGAKFSGNAFRFVKGYALHHGTLLINSHYERIARYLTVSKAKLEAKGVKSVQSRVINLAQVKPDISVLTMEEKLIEAFYHYCTNNLTAFSKTDLTRLDVTEITQQPDFVELEKHFSSWEWRYGRAFKFDVHIENKFEWGLVNLGLVIEGGLISQAAFYSDALDSDLISLIPQTWKGNPLDSSKLAHSLYTLIKHDTGRTVADRKQMINDLATWVINQGW